MLNLSGKAQGAVISCNVSYKEQIDAETLAGILSGCIELSPNWISHIDTFFNELPSDYLLGFAKENSITIEQLESVFYSLPSVLQGKKFKKILSEWTDNRA